MAKRRKPKPGPLVAIGGGEIQVTCSDQGETQLIDEEIVRLAQESGDWTRHSQDTVRPHRLGR